MKKIWGFAFASLMAAGAAHALQLPSTSSFTDTTTAGTDIGNWSETVALRQFNPALGQLTAVTFTLSGEVLVAFYALSKQATPQSVTNTLQATLGFALPTLQPQTLSFTADPDSYLLQAGEEQTRTLTDDASTSFTLASGWDAFIGQGNFNVGVEAVSSSAGSGGAGIEDYTLPTATASLTVRYDYTAKQVPEPGSMALMALGLAASMLAARRRT